MKRYKYILFDLDGTLTDSGPGIMNAARYALDSYGIKEPVEVLRTFIGPPLDKTFMERYGFTREKAFEGIAKFREYYTDKGIYENSVYEGIPELLQRLKDDGRILAIASSKPLVQVHRVLSHFDIDKYFDVVMGCELDGTRSAKDEVIEEVLRQLTTVEDKENPLSVEFIKENTIMIGDRSYDAVGAKKMGLPCIGVLYGYGNSKEFEDAGAEAIAETVNELDEILLSNNNH